MAWTKNFDLFFTFSITFCNICYLFFNSGFDDMLNEGFVDTFRHFYPDLEKKYSFWTYMMNARSKNVGWRLDYFVTSKRLVDQICDNQIRDQVFGSDHCPSTLFLALWNTLDWWCKFKISDFSLFSRIFNQSKSLVLLKEYIELYHAGMNFVGSSSILEK